MSTPDDNNLLDDINVSSVKTANSKQVYMPISTVTPRNFNLYNSNPR